MPRTGIHGEFPCLEASVVDDPGRGRPPKDNDYKPIAPYDSDPDKASHHVFDRVTGEPIACDKLKTYARALCQYHLSSEDKFPGGHPNSPICGHLKIPHL